MKRIYEKSEVLFAVLWIIAYVVGMSAADSISAAVGVEKSVSFLLSAGLTGLLLGWIMKNGLMRKYGLCKTDIKSASFLYYIPLVLTASCNLWLGVYRNMEPLETALYIGSMIFVGFLEEVIFRGLLFKAMAKDNVKSAVIVSSLTFGIGHIVNLFNGSGMELVANLCQVVYATAFGFLFVVLFYRGKSLIPCIVTHSVVNALSAFARQPGIVGEIVTATLLTAIALTYALFLLKTLPPYSGEE